MSAPRASKTLLAMFQELPLTQSRPTLHTLEGVDTQRDQIAHITVTACHIIHSTANMLTMSKGQFLSVLIKDMEFAINIVLHQQQDLLGHFFTVAVDQLNAVIVIRIMTGRNHDAAVEVIHASNVSYRRRGSNVQQIDIRPEAIRPATKLYSNMYELRRVSLPMTIRAGSVSPLRSRKAL